MADPVSCGEKMEVVRVAAPSRKEEGSRDMAGNAPTDPSTGRRRRCAKAYRLKKQIRWALRAAVRAALPSDREPHHRSTLEASGW